MALLLPEIGQTIDDKVAGQPRRRKIEKQFIALRQENAKRGELFLGVKVMVDRLQAHSGAAPSRKRANQDRRFGIERKTQHRFIFLGGLVAMG
jgi:hypothetical protein